MKSLTPPSRDSRRLRRYRALLAGLLLATGGGAQAALSYEEGLARDPRTNLPLYREQHLVRRDGGTPVGRLVIYRCLDGTAFARKLVDYRRSSQAPDFALEDARLGYAEGLRRAGSAISLFVRERATEPKRTAALAASPVTLVADAGFDEFVRDQWLRLQAGTSVPLSFAVPSRLESLGFKVYRVGSLELGGEPAELFRLRLGGLLGWIAPHIDVAYGRDSRRLLRFEGLSNLREDDGDSQLVARIEFPTPATATNEAQWRDFAREPLSACRVRG
ncbi:MAG: hypothetical protein KA196_07565 [Arenimonas sp.]|nr:hypothetical protein [Arenimonas sp.]